MTPTMLYLLCVVIGGATGLRTLTGIAMVCIAAQTGWPHLGSQQLGWQHQGWLHLAGTGLGFLAMPISLYIFVALAVGELIADKLPVPSRIQPGPLMARAAFGGFAASALAVAAGALWVVPALLGAVAAVVGAYAGYWLRRMITRRGMKDLPVALLEDATAVLLALFAVSRF